MTGGTAVTCSGSVMSGLCPQPLPAGHRCRPATAADAGSLHRMVVACERALHGRALTDADRVAAELAPPGAQSAATVVVLDPAGGPAGWAWVRGRRARVEVHPGQLGCRGAPVSSAGVWPAGT
ncbi:hypothetical protein A6P39_006645 [Streptomyces sp. FXJ1.172]|uniref:hypothetical protein n=1 Tax=Streptomyces sp. FXJ1.172 TaxID=710705 RepID=UPI001331775A|nr:hypothetical protein [Streptomyces sp. FXJ1.172]WEO93713.1 hypothetical protein A6P39_006645 [Streptomyces sp. FXJ1.172]